MESQKEAIYNKHVAPWFNGQIGAADIRDDVYAAMDEYAAELRKENEELRAGRDAFEYNANQYNDQLTALQSSNEAKDKQIKVVAEQLAASIKDYNETKKQLEYWKQRCEAAEENIRTYSEWQDEADGDNNEEYYHLWRDALNKWQQLKNEYDSNC